MSDTSLIVVPSWHDLVQTLALQHNGIMSIELHFGHDGDKTCRFRDYDKVLVEHSCNDMQRSVTRCYQDWTLIKSVQIATKHGDLYERCALCGREKWTHQHPNFYGPCAASKDDNVDR